MSQAVDPIDRRDEMRRSAREQVRRDIVESIRHPDQAGDIFAAAAREWGGLVYARLLHRRSARAVLAAQCDRAGIDPTPLLATFDESSV